MDVIIGVLADTNFFRTFFDNFAAVFANGATALARAGIRIASRHRSCIQNTSSFAGSIANIQALGLARAEFTQLIGQAALSTWVFKPIGNLVGDDYVISCAGTTVGHTDGVVQAITWASVCWTANFAAQNGSCTHESTERYRRCADAETSASCTFSFTTQADAHILALAITQMV